MYVFDRDLFLCSVGKISRNAKLNTRTSIGNVFKKLRHGRGLGNDFFWISEGCRIEGYVKIVFRFQVRIIINDNSTYILRTTEWE